MAVKFFKQVVLNAMFRSACTETSQRLIVQLNYFTLTEMGVSLVPPTKDQSGMYVVHDVKCVSHPWYKRYTVRAGDGNQPRLLLKPLLTSC